MEPLKIVIVDDDPDIGRFMKLKLAKEAPDKTFHFVEGGAECLGYIKENKTDCILSDYQMPGMDGMELLVNLRNSGDDTPFIFLTGQGNQEVAREAFKNGADDYFTKESGFAHFTRISNSIDQAVRRRVAETQRKRIEEAERRSAKSLREAQHLAHIGSWQWTVATDTAQWSEELYHINGLDPNSSAPSYAELPTYCTPDSWKRLSDAVAATLQSGVSYGIDFDILRSDGAIIHTFARGEADYDADGVIVGLHGTVQDITKCRAAEEQMEMLKRSIDVHFDGAYWIDNESRFVYVNDTGCEHLGYRLEELKGKTIFDVNPLASPERMRQVWEELRDKGRYISESVHRRKDGSEFPVEIATTYFRFDGKEYACGFARDITRRKREEERAAQERANFLKVFAAAPVGLLLLDKETVIVNTNSRMSAMILRDPVEIIGKRAGGGLGCKESLGSPDGCGFGDACRDCPLRKGIEDALTCGQSICGEVFNLTLIVGGVEQERWISVNAEPVEIDGRSHLVVSVDDVTRWKQAEEALNESIERFSALFESANDGIFLQKDGVFVDCNTRGVLMYGYDDKTEITGHGPMEFAPEFQPDGESSEKKAMRYIAAALEGTPQSFYWTPSRKDGSLFDAEVSLGRLDMNGSTYLQAIVRDVTERVKTVNALRASQNFLEAIIETEPECVKLLSKDGSVLMMNRAGLDMIDAESFDQVKGLSVLGLIAPEDRDAFMEVGNKVFRGESATLEFGVTGFKGRSIRLETHAVPLRDEKGEITALLGITRDITERKRAEDNLLSEKNKLDSVLATIGDGISVQDTEFRVLYQNHAHINMIGYHVGEYCYSAYEHNDSVCEGCPVDAAFQDGQVHTTQRTAVTDKGAIYVDITASALRDAAGNIVAGIEVSHNVTEQKTLERARQDFISMLTHDLKSPLSAISGYSELLRGTCLNENVEAVEMLQAIQRSSDKMNRLIGDFLAVSRIEAGRLKISPAPEYLKVLIEESANAFVHLAEKKGVRFTTEVMDMPTALVDRHLLERSVSNLLDNAMNFTPAGGTIKLTAKTADEADGSFIVISVIDNGPGIAVEEQHKVFEKYYRSARTADIKGTGLGLAIVKAVAEAHGGRVELESEVGKGSVFRLIIPVQNQDSLQ